MGAVLEPVLIPLSLPPLSEGSGPCTWHLGLAGRQVGKQAGAWGLEDLGSEMHSAFLWATGGGQSQGGVGAHRPETSATAAQAHLSKQKSMKAEGAGVLICPAAASTLFLCSFCGRLESLRGL